MRNDFQNKNCIVTGGAGFIGLHLVKALQKRGANIFMIDNFHYGNHRAFKDSKVCVITGDVRSEIVYKKLPKKHYHFFFHLAAPSTTAMFNENFSECVDVTINGFLRAIEFAFQQKCRFVYATSGSVYSGINPPHSENSLLNFNRLNAYAKNKFLTEYLANTYWPHFKTLGLRILAGFGPGEENKKEYASVVYSFCRSMYQGKSPSIWGNGKQRRDFIFIQDIIDIVLTLAPACPEPIVNVGTGRDISFNHLVALINEVLKTNILSIHTARPALYLERTIADTRLLKKYYRKQFTPLKDGVKKTIKSFSNTKI